MKTYLLVILLALNISSVYSQSVVDGYYIDLNNDSVSVKIKVPKILFSRVDIERLERKVKSKDSTMQGFEKFRPNEIKGFGFDYKNKSYKFVAKTTRKKQLKFFEVIYAGNNESAYYYYRIDDTGIKQEIVIVEKENGEDLILKNSMSRKKIKNKLTDFFRSKPIAQQVIQAQSISRIHLNDSVKEIMESINKSYASSNNRAKNLSY